MPNLIQKIETFESTFDFTSSGQGEFVGTAIHFDDNLIFNGIERISFEDDRFQSSICNCCGYEGCSSGSWVSLRRLGGFFLFIPAIEAMSEGKWESVEYSPPYFLRKHGVPAFSTVRYNELRKVIPKLPKPDAVQSLSNAELLAILQLEAPGRVLGELGDEVSFNSEFVIAVCEGNHEDEVLAFNNLLGKMSKPNKANLPQTIDRLVEFILDLPEFPQWTPFGYAEGSATLYLGFNGEVS